jgi:peroxin-10
VRDSLLSKLQELNRFEGIKPGISNAKSLGSQPTVAPLKCIICSEPSTNPCAARCGHICCQNCWLAWLKQKNACPLCRQEASINTITRIKLKE